MLLRLQSGGVGGGGRVSDRLSGGIKMALESFKHVRLSAPHTRLSGTLNVLCRTRNKFAIVVPTVGCGFSSWVNSN